MCEHRRVTMCAANFGDYARSKIFFRRSVARLKKSAPDIFDSSTSGASEM
jgi:hypothetical protein